MIFRWLPALMEKLDLPEIQRTVQAPQKNATPGTAARTALLPLRSDGIPHALFKITVPASRAGIVPGATNTVPGVPGDRKNKEVSRDMSFAQRLAAEAWTCISTCSVMEGQVAVAEVSNRWPKSMTGLPDTNEATGTYVPEGYLQRRWHGKQSIKRLMREFLIPVEKPRRAGPCVRPPERRRNGHASARMEKGLDKESNKPRADRKHQDRSDSAAQVRTRQPRISARRKTAGNRPAIQLVRRHLDPWNENEQTQRS